MKKKHSWWKEKVVVITQKCFTELFLTSVKDWEELVFVMVGSYESEALKYPVNLHRQSFSAALLGNCVDVHSSSKSRIGRDAYFRKARISAHTCWAIVPHLRNSKPWQRGIFLVLLQCQDSAVNIFTWVICVCVCVCLSESVDQSQKLGRAQGVKMPFKREKMPCIFKYRSQTKCPQSKQLLHKLLQLLHKLLDLCIIT